MAEEAEWLDVETASQHVGLSTNTLYRLVRDGKLGALRFPVRIRRSDLDAVTELCRIRPGELAHLHGRRDRPRYTAEPPGSAEAPHLP